MSCTNGIWTLEELELLLRQWKEAYFSVSSAKSYEIDGRRLTHQNIGEIRRELGNIKREIDKIKCGRTKQNKVQFVIPHGV